MRHGVILFVLLFGGYEALQSDPSVLYEFNAGVLVVELWTNGIFYEGDSIL